MKLNQFILVLFFFMRLAAAPVGVNADPVALLDQPLIGTSKGDPVSYEFDYRIVVTAPYKTKQLRVWVPVPPSDDIQQFELLAADTFPLEVHPTRHQESKFGNQFDYYEFDRPVGAQIIRRHFRVTTHEVRWNVDAAKVGSIEQWPENFSAYLRSDASVAVNDQIIAQLNRFLPDKTHGYQDLTAAISWVDQNLTYSHTKASLQASSMHALNQRTGHCSDYHGLCSAFGRALGYPTRVTYGMAAYEKASPSHCKLEAYLPRYGWVSYDVSETQKLMNLVRQSKTLTEPEKQAMLAAARKRLMRGFRDVTWFRQTVGTDYHLSPEASRRVPVVRTIYAEADGRPLPEPDPADKSKQQFSWMTTQRIESSRPVTYPFKDLARLKEEAGEMRRSAGQ